MKALITFIVICLCACTPPQPPQEYQVISKSHRHIAAKTSVGMKRHFYGPWSGKTMPTTRRTPARDEYTLVLKDQNGQHREKRVSKETYESTAEGQMITL